MKVKELLEAISGVDSYSIKDNNGIVLDDDVDAKGIIKFLGHGVKGFKVWVYDEAVPGCGGAMAHKICCTISLDVGKEHFQEMHNEG